MAYTLSQVVLVLSFWNPFSSYSLVTCMYGFIHQFVVLYALSNVPIAAITASLQWIYHT